MSLWFYLVEMQPVDIYERNITHNLIEMASDAGIYQHLWRPSESGFKNAQELIEPLRKGLELLRSDPQRFKMHDASNKWGTYEQFIPFVEEVLAACIAHPEASIRTSR